MRDMQTTSCQMCLLPELLYFQMKCITGYYCIHVSWKYLKKKGIWFNLCFSLSIFSWIEYLCTFFFHWILFFLQDLKNQILTTNVWVEHVSKQISPCHHSLLTIFRIFLCAVCFLYFDIVFPFHLCHAIKVYTERPFSFFFWLLLLHQANSGWPGWGGRRYRFLLLSVACKYAIQ